MMCSVESNIGNYEFKCFSTDGWQSALYDNSFFRLIMGLPKFFCLVATWQNVYKRLSGCL